MDDQNILNRMLAKGDFLREHYQDFDFSKLDNNQIKHLNRLAFFSRHRERIVRKFNSTKIRYDEKIAFLDQHSMKLGNSIFYDVESKRQEYIQSFDFMPISTCFFGFLIFCGFAFKAPMTSNLYKELGVSIFLGGGISYGYVHYYRRKYLNLVDETYDNLKFKFANNPIFSTMKEDEQIIKNFGFVKFSDKDEDDPRDAEAEEMGLVEAGLFDGTPDQETQDIKQRLLSNFYGS